jgi:tRNA threonylcarbamoyladenosine biosynthesis protein TsaE
LGSLDDVNSPTYSLINEYKTNKGETIYHIDCYRINSIEEAIEAGVEDVIYSDAYCFIEWPSKIKSLLENKKLVKVDIQVNGIKRLISMELTNNSEVLSN